MGSQDQRQKQTEKTEDAPEVEELEAKDQSELDADVEGVLSDIDDVLEENAQEFVAQYVQKGGE